MRLLPRSLRSYRRYWALFFLALFLFLLWVADYGRMHGWQIPLFLELDPLTALAGFLTSGTLYKGLALALCIIVPTLFLGRFFCSWVCPLGITSQILGRLFNRRKPADEQHLNAYRPLFRIKYYLLMALLVLAALGSLQIGLLDPIALIYRSFTVGVLPGLDRIGLPVHLHAPVFQGGVLVALLFAAILVANRFMPRFWCRVLCPLGALLGVLSRRAPLRIQRDIDKCTDCGKCVRHCQGACDPDRELRIAECHLCMNCIEDCPEDALHFGLRRARSSAHRPIDISRRRVVETAVATAVLLPMVRSSASGRTLPTAAVIRPPGSLPEEEFLGRCIKCAACMRVCPTNVLQPALLEAGLEGLWTPVLVNRIGWCEQYCVACGQACPTGAIRRISAAEKTGQPPHAQPIRLGTAFYDYGRCLPWAMHIPCIVCEEMCPTSPKAIWYKVVQVAGRDGKPLELKQPYVEPGLCIGCGICENKCPVEDLPAIRVSSVGETRSTINQMLLKGSST